MHKTLKRKWIAAIRDASMSSPSHETALRRTVAMMTEYIGAVPLSDYNEGWTRKEFIDPILRALGWDVNRRKHVAMERRIEYDRVADYILFNRHREPFAVVEAKKLHEELTQHEEQLFKYMEVAHARTGVLANGFSWHVYKATNTEPELVLTIDDILTELTDDIATKLCALIGFRENHFCEKQTPPKPKPPSPLEDGWVEMTDP